MAEGSKDSKMEIGMKVFTRRARQKATASIFGQTALTTKVSSRMA